MSILSILKVKFTADTTEFKKSAAEGQKAMDEFTGKSGDAFSNLANAVGVDLGAIGKSFGEFKTAIGGLGTAFSTASKASGGFSGAMNVLKLALISTGIGAFVVILGSLVAYFTSTQEGANKLSTIMAGVGAVFKVLTDRAADLGKIIFDAFDNPKQAISSLWEFLKGNFINHFTGLIDLFKSVGSALGSMFEGDWEGMKKAALDAAQAVVKIGTGLDADQQNKIGNYIAGVATEMSNEAKQAAVLKAKLNELEIAERNLAVTSKQREAAIKNLKYISEDVTKSDQQRIDATQKAIDIQKAMLNDERSIAAQRIKILEEQMKLGNNTADDYQALADAKTALADVDARIIEQMIEMNNKFNQLNTEIVNRRKEQDNYLKTIDTDLSGRKWTKWGTNSGFDVDTKKLAEVKTFAAEVKSTMLDLSNAVQDSMSQMAVGVAESFGEMMAGTGTISQIGTLVLSSLAELLITIGKMLIQTGMGLIAVKIALKTINPYVALAAGAALVALGAAVKSGLSNAANSGGSSGYSSMASPVTSVDTRSTSRSASSIENSSTMNVVVTGEFKQRGSDLVAVVKKENNRQALTT